jgi:hypothetical protein
MKDVAHLGASCRTHGNLASTDHIMKNHDRSIQAVLTRALVLTFIVFGQRTATTASVANPMFSDANWISMGGIPGANGPVFSAAVDALGNVFIGGSFIVVGDVIANRIAKYDGQMWSTLGLGLNSNVYAIAVSGGAVYVGGSFTKATNSDGTVVTVNRIAKWDKAKWWPLGLGMNNKVSALAVSGTLVYAGGNFTTAGGNPANYVAKWDAHSWSAVGSGLGGGDFQESSVSALAVLNSEVYAGGNFTRATNSRGVGLAVNRIAKWNGDSWSAVGAGVQGAVTALAVSDRDVYAGGFFFSAGCGEAAGIAKWDGTNWSALGSGMGGANPYVYALAVSGSEVYAGGDFASAGGTSANRIAKWDGSSWSALGSGRNSSLYALAVSGSNVYAGGGFTTKGDTPANYISKWNGCDWSALGMGMNDLVLSVAVSGSDVYVGGYFTNVGGIAANRIAKWNGSSWSALTLGVSGPPYGFYPSVSALAANGNDLYAAGAFTSAGETAANRIAKWDGAKWSTLGSGFAHSADLVSALAVSGADLYVGGLFTNVGAIAANSIARWDGTNWSALGSGLGATPRIPYPCVNTLAVSGSAVYAGGVFAIAGDVTANHIAKWDGNSWSTLGSGMDNYVSALAVSGSDLYAAGGFTNAGGAAANYVAKWNGSIWSALGSGMNSNVSALAVFGSNLYAAGFFTRAGGIAANYIAKWNGSSWSALGSGVGAFDAYHIHTVLTLAVSGNDLYAGGTFAAAGGKTCGYIARAYLPPLPALSLLRSGNDLMVTWPSVDAFTLEEASALMQPARWTTHSAGVRDDGTTKSVTIPSSNSGQFFRLRRP